MMCVCMVLIPFLHCIMHCGLVLMRTRVGIIFQVSLFLASINTYFRCESQHSLRNTVLYNSSPLFVMLGTLQHNAFIKVCVCIGYIGYYILCGH